MNSPINNIPIVAVVAEPVKKVRKVKKSNPLKGAMIDADLQEEVDVVKTKIVVEEDEKFLEEKLPALQFPPNGTIEYDDKGIKVMYDENEGWVEQEDDDAEIAELERALEVRKMRKALKNNISAMKPIVIERRLKVIKNLRETLEKERGELEALETLDDDELIETIMGNTALEAEFRITAEPKKALKKKNASNGENNGSRTQFDRVADWKKIVEGTELIISYKGTTSKFTKIDGSLVRNGTTYPTMGLAGKAFYAECGLGFKAFNAWAEFKMINDDKKVSIGDFVKE
jgi:hypothetical protein